VLIRDDCDYDLCDEDYAEMDRIAEAARKLYLNPGVNEMNANHHQSQQPLDAARAKLYNEILDDYALCSVHESLGYDLSAASLRGNLRSRLNFAKSSDGGKILRKVANDETDKASECRRLHRLHRDRGYDWSAYQYLQKAIKHELAASEFYTAYVRFSLKN
jgi:hypothetical protein